MSHAYGRRVERSMASDRSDSDAARIARMLGGFAEARDQQFIAERQELWRSLIEWLGHSLAVSIPFALFASYVWSYVLRLRHMENYDQLRRRLRELVNSSSDGQRDSLAKLVQDVDKAVDDVHANVMRGMMGVGHRALVLETLRELRLECRNAADASVARTPAIAISQPEIRPPD